MSLKEGANTGGDAEPRVALLIPGLQRFYSLTNPLSYALMRMAFGLILVTHGLPKLRGDTHGSMGNPFASSVNFITNKLHLPAPEVLASFVTLLESGGGLMLAAGLLTRLIAPMIAIEMAMICIILLPNWAWLDRGIEYPLLMGFLALHISFRGGGVYAVDRLIGKEL